MSHIGVRILVTNIRTPISGVRVRSRPSPSSGDGRDRTRSEIKTRSLEHTHVMFVEIKENTIYVVIIGGVLINVRHRLI